MGQIIRISCKKCESVWEVKTGMGMDHAFLENCLDDFDASEKDQIKSSLSQKEFPHFTFMYSAAVCNNCKKIISIAELEDLDISKKYTAACPDCGMSDVNIIDSNIGSCKCPKCGHYKLSSEISGLWD